MRYARILSIGLVVTVAFAWSAAAVENAHELAGYCQSLERAAPERYQLAQTADYPTFRHRG
jgi:hypothetical protein